MRSDPTNRPPVLLLTGLGLTASSAARAMVELERHFRVLAAPLGIDPPLNGAHGGVPLTGADVLALLDRAGIERAHVIGLSFGGIVAQEFAIGHPERVCSLVLGATSAGGELYVPPDGAIRGFVRRLSGLPAEEGLWASVPYVYSPVTYRRRARLIGEDITERLRRHLDPAAHRRLHAVARAHDAATRLDGLSAPTLVIHGQQDRIVPVDNGRLLADAIPGARYVAVPDAGHALTTDAPDISEELISFLLGRSRRGTPRAPRSARAGRA